MALRDAVAAREAVAAEERRVSLLTTQRAGARVGLDRIDKELTGLDRHLSAARSVLQRHFADETFWKASHGELQTSTPWLGEEMQRMRDICFKSALELHRAFIDVAAKPIRNNLNALFGVLMGDGVDDTLKTVLPSLWTTLFLVVPVLSTTFASVARMLGPMPPESLGWLLVDEAGQAVPQAAVGALMRARRAAIVGDPLQIEPVVTLPLSLVERIARRMSVDPETWAAPMASAQTLADAASRYQSWMEQLDGSVRVGAPLLVHRHHWQRLRQVVPGRRAHHRRSAWAACPPGAHRARRVRDHALSHRGPTDARALGRVRCGEPHSRAAKRVGARSGRHHPHFPGP
jgi:hypothetical protein